MSSICDKPYASSDKWTASIISGLSFLLLSSPYTYSLTRDLLDRLGIKIDLATLGGCPSTTGVVTHAVVYAILLRILLNRNNDGCLKPYTSKDKWIISVLGGLLFIIVSSPFAQQGMNKLLGGIGLNISSDEGESCPNIRGKLVQTVVFTLLVRLLMR